MVRAAMSLFGVALLLVAAVLGFAPSAAASTQLQNLTIAPVFPDGEPDPPVITATAAILIDMDSGQILYSRNANARLPMASTTKIMTATLALESLALDTKVTVSAGAVGTAGSKAALVKGEVLTVEQLLNALLVVSGNDAAIALAQAAAGSVQAFVERMNEKAKALGLSNTHFVNPSGLNDGKHFSSAKDLATLTQYAMKNPTFRRIVDTREYVLPTLDDNTPRKFDNQNELLHKLPWVIGVKTGSTPYAKFCVVAAGTKEGVSLIAVVLGASEDEIRWKEAEALLNYGFSLYPRTILVDRGQLIAELAVPDLLGRTVRLVTDRPLTVRLFKADVVTGSVKLEREPILPVDVGEAFGAIEFTANGKSLGSVTLLAAQPVPKPSLTMIMRYWREFWPPRIQLGDYLGALTPH
jgi:D-alanyl-D-alanine carboxypeptidase (penicillin-binding protein 5/6)